MLFRILMVLVVLLICWNVGVQLYDCLIELRMCIIDLVDY